MMDLPELVILDVGHGNSAILRDTNGTVIIDCGPGSTLAEAVEYLQINEISHILISHADRDHIAGAINILANRDIRVHHVLLNADALRRTDIWKNLRFTLRDIRRRTGTRVHIGLTTEHRGQLNVRQIEIEVLAPIPEIAMSGVGGQDLQERQLTSNCMSVVVGLVHNSHRVAILPGDIDEIGLHNLLEDRDDLEADILVFPHHGGGSGSGDDEQFAQMLCHAVKPKLIVFSIDRNHLVNPREGIIKGIKSVVPTAHIMCTQLSRRCAAHIPDSDYHHLSDLPANGRDTSSCCGGTISIKLNGKDTITPSLFVLHKDFVGSKVATALCRRQITKQPSAIKP